MIVQTVVYELTDGTNDGKILWWMIRMEPLDLSWLDLSWLDLSLMGLVGRVDGSDVLGDGRWFVLDRSQPAISDLDFDLIYPDTE